MVASRALGCLPDGRFRCDDHFQPSIALIYANTASPLPFTLPLLPYMILAGLRPAPVSTLWSYPNCAPVPTSFIAASFPFALVFALLFCTVTRLYRLPVWFRTRTRLYSPAHCFILFLSSSRWYSPLSRLFLLPISAAHKSYRSFRMTPGIASAPSFPNVPFGSSGIRPALFRLSRPEFSNILHRCNPVHRASAVLLNVVSAAMLVAQMPELWRNGSSRPNPRGVSIFSSTALICTPLAAQLFTICSSGFFAIRDPTLFTAQPEPSTIRSCSIYMFLSLPINYRVLIRDAGPASVRTNRKW